MIFESFVAVRFRKLDNKTKSPISDVASIKSGELLILRPVISDKASIAYSRYFTSVLMPVPIAVPPRFTTLKHRA